MSEFGGDSYEMDDAEFEGEGLDFGELDFNEAGQTTDLIFDDWNASPEDETLEYAGQEAVNQILDMDLPEMELTEAEAVESERQEGQESQEEAEVDPSPLAEIPGGQLEQSEAEGAEGRESGSAPAAMELPGGLPGQLEQGERSDRAEASGCTINQIIDTRIIDTSRLTLDQIYDRYGDIIPISRSEMEGRIDGIHQRDMEAGVLGSYERGNEGRPGSITLDKSQSMADKEATLTHEDLHRASFQMDSREEREDGTIREVHTNGLSRTETTIHPDGRTSTTRLGGVGLDEGFTELLAQGLVAERDAARGETMSRQEGYEGTPEIVHQAAQILGFDVFEAAKFGGELEALQQAFDRLGGEYAFDTFCKGLDKTIDYENPDPDTRLFGKEECHSVLSRMEAMSQSEKEDA